MADIALLVAEEYEKKLKRGAPGAGADAKDDEGSQRGGSFGAVTKDCGSWVESAASRVKVRVALLAKADMEEEPMTGVAMAAFHGFFSA